MYKNRFWFSRNAFFIFQSGCVCTASPCPPPAANYKALTLASVCVCKYNIVNARVIPIEIRYRSTHIYLYYIFVCIKYALYILMKKKIQLIIMDRRVGDRRTRVLYILMYTHIICT